MDVIERKDSKKNKKNRAMKHLLMGSTLDTLGIFIRGYTESSG